ncbi:ACP S-malonyltransferase [Methylomarinum sp. Ch1-1]|uniref:Malonyl CoA-acyl carrier protein transacylase n=1 Tax=Methylomarinum roseum TaxID=3067653 RepID=A0AAU7NSU9_9GAMM|nr:ACP S-malonyltransferase [Methylomarinum sp. Ch1-1]MDP4519952.1 ACP S-malonyltransferase [Methylomarinum sp. Ch1-1]
MSEQNYNLAFVFPGQGSQSVGMMSGLADIYPVVKQTFEQASEALGLDLWALVANGPADELNQTHNTQPAMLTAGVAMWRVWCEQSQIRPAWMAGHSLGEYTALVCSAAIGFEDGVKLVAERGRLMQEAVPAGVGAMAAIIGLDDHQVVKACNDSADNEIVSAVNFNAPGQVVIAGHAAAVERAMQAAKDMGAKRALKLPVSVPSHCALMEPAAEKLAERLAEIAVNIPNVTLIHNADVAAHSAAEVIRNALREQLFKPVRWVDSVKFMHDQGVSEFVECGPGKVLMGLNKRIVKEATHVTMYDPETLNQVLEQLNG